MAKIIHALIRTKALEVLWCSKHYDNGVVEISLLHVRLSVLVKSRFSLGRVTEKPLAPNCTAR